ncbi:MAG TPA: quinol:cytochrome C oxidoreductase [Ignavibacteriales bacterium]|nr:quinol:cytochrome C oxidoreductase [Ignavibacteriales bacterium]
MNSEDSPVYIKKELPKKYANLGYALLAIGIILFAVSYSMDAARTSFNGIIGFMFLFSIGVGSLFLVALEYLGGAEWSVPFRRVSEFFAALLFIVPVIALPAIFNLHDIFHWTHTEAVESDAILKGKAPYLNEPFFIVRTIVVFLVFIAFYFVLIGNSQKQDKKADNSLSKKNVKFSAAFMPVFAIFITVMAMDWMMSLEPHWFSTIFGVYYFAGTLVAALAALTFAAVTLNEKGYLAKGIFADHYYSLGALMFGFINFWAYIAFSQFLLIWYANLPEETFWFIHRWEGGWKYISIGLIFVHFIIPYALLLSQPSKMNPRNLKFASLWILFAHFYDMYWLVMPNYGKENIVFGWMEFVFPIIAAGLMLTVFNFAAKNKNLAPVNDPKLKKGLDFRM